MPRDTHPSSLPTRERRYAVTVRWPLEEDQATTGYDRYSRDHVFIADGKPTISGSADPAFRGDPARHNPEDMLVYALSACHMLWYLHLCAVNDITVTGYEDSASGVMEEGRAGGRFTSATLRPHVHIAHGDPARAQALHADAHKACFIAQSVNFPVYCEPRITSDG